MMNKSWFSGFLVACLICFLALACILRVMAYTPKPIPVAEAVIIEEEI